MDMIHFRMANLTRRSFLHTAPLATAVAGLGLGEPALFAQPAANAGSPQAYKLISADALSADTAALRAKPGNTSLLDNPALPFTIVLTVEEKKSAKEFEYHEGRDHIFQVLEGSTVYELGGIPQMPHATKPGEWLAPASEGATKLTLGNGDLLVIPRGVPHRRSTETSVTFYLISTTGILPA
jgi:mannose-6-phosphate isomerase-like protein (cupin superfamily)